MQLMLNIVTQCCWKWRLETNQHKTQIVQFRQKSPQRSSIVFKLGLLKLSYTDQYKYLGLTLDEHMTFREAVSVLAQSAGRALGSIMNKVKHCGNLGFNTYTQLYESGFDPCPTMPLVFGGSGNTQVATLCIIELLDLFWEFIN